MRTMLAALAVVLAGVAGPQPAAHADWVEYCFLTVVVGTSETGTTEVDLCFICYYPPNSMTPPLPQKICPPVVI